MDIKNITEQVKALAIEVGAFIRQQREEFNPDRVIMKSSHDYVSYVDKEAETRIVAGLRKIMPEAGFVTEEGTSVATRDERAIMEKGKEYCWVVDPLDGTTNFIHGMAPYCVCIALRTSTEIIIGVVYEVVNNELFWAYKGGGAYCNDKPIKASSTESLNQALLVLGLPYDVKRYKEFYKHLSGALYGNVASIRNLGSAEAELCYVACGRIDAYVEPCIYPWDVCAGSIIIQEAGGKISDFGGGNDLWEQGREVLATNGKIHSELLSAVIASKEAVNASF